MSEVAHSLNLLIVEDNPGDYLLISDYLEESMSFPVLKQARDCGEATRLLEEKDNNYDVILLDLSLPDLSGETLIKRIVSLSGNSPVVVLTGFADADFAMRSLSLGIADYLIKENINPILLQKSLLYALERQKFYLSIRESERRYSELFQLSPLPMWVYDLDSCRFLDVNESAIQHYGFTRDEFLGMSIQDINLPEELDGLEAVVRATREGEQMTYRGICKHRIKSGRTITVEVKSNVIAFKGRRAKVVLATDITDRLQYIEDIEAQNRRLRDIAWTQSHIVRAPLARMMAIIDQMEDDTLGMSDKEDLCRSMVASAYELDGIIRRITSTAETIKVKELNHGLGMSNR